MKKFILATLMLAATCEAPVVYAKVPWLNACAGWVDDDDVPAVYARGSSWTANKGNTWGWQLMTSVERTEYQNKIRSFKTHDECMQYQDEHHKQMGVRAKEKGVTLPAMRRGADSCDSLRARGFVK